MQQADLIWHNGEMVAWEDAKVHVLTHGLHYGTGVFEGIRAYETPKGTAIFRHHDHLDRLFKSAELYYMPIPYTLEELRSATHELIAANELRECYIRPIVFRGYGQMGLYPLDAPVEVSIAVWPWGAYLGEEGKQQGIRAKVASWRRIPHDALIPHAKASGQYLNSVLAKIEASKAGYQEAILLDHHGFVCEGSGENIYAVRDGQILTPPHTAGILDGISRKSIIQIARDLGHDGGRARHGAGRAVPGRRGVPDRHRRRARAGPRDRRPHDRQRRAGIDHARDPARLRRCAARPRRSLRRVARSRRGPDESGSRMSHAASLRRGRMARGGRA